MISITILLDPSRLDDNELTALAVGLFDNNTALTELYVVKRINFAERQSTTGESGN